MKKTIRLMLVAVAPVLLVAPVLGQEKALPKAENVAEAEKPSVTFYYFDG